MKKLKLIGFLMILASSLIFIQCTSEPIPGPAGIDGVDGVDGVDGTASCVACHTNSHRSAIIESYYTSDHSVRGYAFNHAGIRGSESGSCAKCHSNEGYIDYVTTGELKPSYDSATPIGCTTCHDQHGTFDFENDGQDYALRTFEPVELTTQPSITIDFEGTSNNCVGCHQPLYSGPTDDGEGKYTIYSKYWGVHHGAEAPMVEGVLGKLIPGSVSYPGIGSSTHRIGSSCVNCHMGETTENNDGMHSFKPTAKACISCHTNGAPTEVAGFNKDFNKLKTLLQEKGYIGTGYDELYPSPNTYSILEAEIIWNYLLLAEDGSMGVHNPEYAKALVKNSLEALESLN